MDGHDQRLHNARASDRGRRWSFSRFPRYERVAKRLVKIAECSIKKPSGRAADSGSGAMPRQTRTVTPFFYSTLWSGDIAEHRRSQASCFLGRRPMEHHGATHSQRECSLIDSCHPGEPCLLDVFSLRRPWQPDTVIWAILAIIGVAPVSAGPFMAGRAGSVRDGSSLSGSSRRPPPYREGLRLVAGGWGRSACRLVFLHVCRFLCLLHPSSKLPERPWKLPDPSPEPVLKTTRRDLLASYRRRGVVSPFIVYKPVEVVSAAAVEREPGYSPGESKMI